MASIAEINGVPIAKIAEMNGVPAAKIVEVNSVPFIAAAPDSVSLNPTSLFFFSYPDTDGTQVTSSQAWTATKISDTYNLVNTFTANGSSLGFLNVTIQDPGGQPFASATIRVTSGTAIADLTVDFDNT